MLVLQEESAAGSTAVQGRARRLVAGGGRTSSGLPTASVCFPISAPAPLPWPPPWCRLQALPFPVWLVRRSLMKHTFKGPLQPTAAHAQPTRPPPNFSSAQPARAAHSSQPPRGPAQRLHTGLCAPTRLPFHPSPPNWIVSQGPPQAYSFSQPPQVSGLLSPILHRWEDKAGAVRALLRVTQQQGPGSRVLPLTRMSHLRFPTPPWLALW